MGYPPPAISRRDGELTVSGTCGCCNGSVCQLIVQQLAGGCVRLAFHGVERHSIVINPAQQVAIASLLRGGECRPAAE